MCYMSATACYQYSLVGAFPRSGMPQELTEQSHSHGCQAGEKYLAVSVMIVAGQDSHSDHWQSISTDFWVLM
jgi:hypothetical protein